MSLEKLHYECGLPWAEHTWRSTARARGGAYVRSLVCPDEPTAYERPARPHSHRLSDEQEDENE